MLTLIFTRHVGDFVILLYITADTLKSLSVLGKMINRFSDNLLYVTWYVDDLKNIMSYNAVDIIYIF